MTTCLQSDVPKGTKLEFETSGKLKGTSVVAAQKGTTVTVENLFHNLPVRRRELERNIKREWGKVISLLNQYACVQTGVKFTVSQTPNKGKRIVLFSTKGNMTTRENIINVFGAKTMAALVTLDLKLELEPTSGPGQRWSTQGDTGTKEILVKGHVSRPIHGEGRQTPDRQMFFVNSRPCGLPQFAKVFNEVYRSFNSSQSPFIFADMQLDTHLYDVNVSPDKRTILLHDQSRMLENLRDALTELFERQDYTVPMSQVTPLKQAPFRQVMMTRQETIQEGPDYSSPNKAEWPPRGAADVSHVDDEMTDSADHVQKMAAAKGLARDAQASNLMARWTDRNSVSHDGQYSSEKKDASPLPDHMTSGNIATGTQHPGEKKEAVEKAPKSTTAETLQVCSNSGETEDNLISRLAKLKQSFIPESLRDDMCDDEALNEPPIPVMAKPVKPPDNAPLSISSSRPPKRPSQEVATITIGDTTVTSIIGTPSKRVKKDMAEPSQLRSHKSSNAAQSAPMPSFGGRLTQMFAAAAAKQQSASTAETWTIDADESDVASSEHSEQDEPEGSSKHIGASDEDTEENSDMASNKSSPMFFEEDDDVGKSSVASKSAASDAEMADDDGETGGESGDEEYADEEGTSDAQEDSKVEEHIAAADGASHESSAENQKRTQALLKGGFKGKYSTRSLVQRLKVDESLLKRGLTSWEANRAEPNAGGLPDAELENGLEAENAEEKLSLTIHKGDFSKMKIVGQFNLGFVLAVRPGTTASPQSAGLGPATQQPSSQQDDELFIIDQHASDEKFNFERLQATTVVQSQRLVRPKPLELTAVEEEIVLENRAALEKNGFDVGVDTSGDMPVGSRCQLLSLPLSRETTFSVADLEELISLLGDNPIITPDDDGGEEREAPPRKKGDHVPRPSKVRKMFAMRACRSSIMIGKALSHRQMERVVRHMGEMEKPWNCPHGRPTMRHLCGLGAAWDEKGWREGDYEDGYGRIADRINTDWTVSFRRMKEEG